MADRARTVGVLGLGVMGGNLAARLVASGFEVVGHDVSDTCNDAAARDGVRIVADAAAVARQAGRIVCLVETGAQVLDVVRQVAPEMGEGDTFLCMSTVDLPVIEEAAGIVARSGADYLDAPVSGGGAAARSGTLVSILGGAAEAVERCRPVIEAVSARHFHVGAIGQGFAAKMVNNLAFHTLSVAVIEAMVLGTKAGIDPDRMYGLLSNATGDSQALRMRVPRMLARDFDGVPLAVAFRELLMETGLAAREGVPVPLARMAEEVHRMGMARGHGPEDGAALVKVYEDLAGVTVEAGTPREEAR